jgi:hypothetical protein
MVPRTKRLEYLKRTIKGLGPRVRPLDQKRRTVYTLFGTNLSLKNQSVSPFHVFLK